MDARDLYIARIAAEAPAFAKVIRAVPAQGGAYRPHPRSRSAAELAWLLAGEAQGALELLDNPRVEWRDPESEAALEGAAAALEQAQAALVQRVSQLDDAAWARPSELVMGGQVAWKASLGEMLWGFLFDAIHHRGQLSTYIRPAGGKVPAIYGPSADDPGA